MARVGRAPRGPASAGRGSGDRAGRRGARMAGVPTGTVPGTSPKVAAQKAADPDAAAPKAAAPKAAAGPTDRARWAGVVSASARITARRTDDPSATGPTLRARLRHPETEHRVRRSGPDAPRGRRRIAPGVLPNRGDPRAAVTSRDPLVPRDPRRPVQHAIGPFDPGARAGTRARGPAGEARRGLRTGARSSADPSAASTSPRRGTTSARRRPPRVCSGRTRSLSPAGAQSRRRSPRVVMRSACSWSRSDARRSRGSSCTRRTCASRSSRWRAGR